MAKGPYLTPQIRRLIVEIYLKNPAIGPSKAREELLKEMKTKGLDRNFGPDFPSVSSVSVELTKYRKKYEERSPEVIELDEPWHVISLSKYDLPADALPIILEIWLSRLQLSPLTIREARWVARLYHVIPDIRLLEYEASSYASHERIAELLDLTGRVSARPHKATHPHIERNVNDILLYQNVTNKVIDFKIIDKEGNDITEETWGNIEGAHIVVNELLERPVRKRRGVKGGTK